MKVLAIIPARGGSKGVPKKNIKKLFGKPLIAHTIEQARHSKLVSNVIVSTDDKEIKRISLAYLAHVIDRPKNLAEDETSTEDVIYHVLESIEGYNTIVLLQCTCPIRAKDDIDNAIKLYERYCCDAVVSVKKGKSVIWKENEKGAYAKPITYEEIENRPKGRNDVDYYEENGSIYVFDRDKFMENECRAFGNTALYVMPIERSVDIDTEDDFEYLEWRNKNGKMHKL